MIRHFVSYPKSGRSWVRYMLVQLGVEQHLHFHHDGFEFNDGARPPLNFDIEKRFIDYSNVDRLVYMERDPRDVIVSLYYQVTGRFRDFFQYEGSLSDFIRDEYFGAVNLRQFQNMWTLIAQKKGFLTISYENLHRDTHGVLREIVDYFCFNVSESQLSEAIRAANFDSMKLVEESNTFSEPWLRSRNGFFKVRSGKIGGYAEDLSAEDVTYLNSIF